MKERTLCYKLILLTGMMLFYYFGILKESTDRKRSDGSKEKHMNYRKKFFEKK